MSVKSSKQASNRVKSLVFGYIREHESLESINIPSLISYTCLTYYFVHEFFSKAREDHFKISDDKMMVTKIEGNGHLDHTIYCNQWINTSSNIIAKWTFSVQNDSNVKSMYFGLASNDKIIDEDFCSQDNGPCYEISSAGDKFSHTFPGGYPLGSEFGWHSNGTITFILDLTNLTFAIQINDEKPKAIFNDIEKGNDIKYKMAVQLCDKNDCVILKEYEESYV
eukprot:301254_1